MTFKVEGYYPSQDSSVGSILAWYQGRPGFKSWQGREFFNEKIQHDLQLMINGINYLKM